MPSCSIPTRRGRDKTSVTVGHQHHFLSRLDRVSREHVELALSLYRDHTLVRYVLGAVRLPEGAERVAISLDHPQEGPFLVVTREGTFVTCLGAGMSAGDLPIVTRGQLDGITAKATSLRSRAEMHVKLFGPEGEAGALVSRIMEAGPELSREEFVAIASLQPLFARFFLTSLIDAVLAADESRTALLRILRRTHRLKPHNRPLLEAHWKQFWAAGHLILLTTMDGRETLGDLGPPGKPVEAVLTAATIRQGIGAVALKGAWGISKIGRSCLGFYKKLFVEGDLVEELVDALLSLYAIATRHTKLRAEVRKAAARSHKDPTLDPLRMALFKTAERCVEDTENAATYQRMAGAALLAARTANLPKGSPYRFERPEDVPDALAMTYAANHTDDFLKDIKQVASLFVMLPWMARAAPEDFYLPADFIKATRIPWRPQDTLDLISRDVELNEQPAPRPEGPTRSGPCPCGSGKKYKRCCGDSREG
jgi:hypothetical protein